MVILKKIKSATLMETLVATVLIMVIFIVASLILNNLFTNRINNNTRSITAKLNEIEYLYINDQIIVPYYDDYNGWDIAVLLAGNRDEVHITATKAHTSKAIKKSINKK